MGRLIKMLTGKQNWIENFTINLISWYLNCNYSMKTGKFWACCRTERWKENADVTARQTRRRSNQKPKWMWMDDVELDRYVGVKRRRKKAFDRKEWASVMRGAKARCKRAVLQRIRRGGSGRRRREFKRHIILRKRCWIFQYICLIKAARSTYKARFSNPACR